MILRELLASTPVYEIIGRRRIEIKGIALEPEEVKKEYLYIYPQDRHDIDYEQTIEEVVANGASAVVVGREHKVLDDSVTFVRTYHYQRFISAISRNFYRNPSQNMNLVGITGSHGKTTVGWMIKSILDEAGTAGLMLGSDHYQVGDHSMKAYPGGMNPLNMNRFLNKAVKERVRWGIIECGYTGIVEDQFSHVWFNSIIYTDLFTYFQNQKADYHYFEMRKTLIDHLKTTVGPVVVNVDDYYAFHLQREGSVRYGLFHPSDITARGLKLHPGSSEFLLVTPKGQRQMGLNIPGIHNVYNALAAVGWSLAEGLKLDDVVRGIESLPEIPGSKEPEEMTGSIEIKEIHRGKFRKLKDAFQELGYAENEDIVTILCTEDPEDDVRYKRLEDKNRQEKDHCILIRGYFPDLDLSVIEPAGLKSINEEAIQCQTDYYKAIQKAVASLPEGGHILLVKG